MKSHDGKSQQPQWPWSDSLDALIAAPDHHSLLFENDSVRVLDTRIRPGEITPVHTHQWPCTFYVRTWSDFVRRDGDGEVALDSRQVEALANPPQVFWSDPSAPHTVENVGDRDLWVIGVELKRDSVSQAEMDLANLSVKDE